MTSSICKVIIEKGKCIPPVGGQLKKKVSRQKYASLENDCDKANLQDDNTNLYNVSRNRKLSDVSIDFEGQTWNNCRKDIRRKTVNRNKKLSFGCSKKKVQPLQRVSDSTRSTDLHQETTSALPTVAICSPLVGRNNGFKGFDDKDLERPSFSFPPIGDKLPYLLSEPTILPTYEIPATINQYLRDYQREGIKFLFQHYTNNKGAILGDDMGLGKTVQVIGFMCALLGKTGTKKDIWKLKPSFIKEMSSWEEGIEPTMECRPFLIIGPSCVLYNWLDELDTWGYFSVGKFHGSDKQQCLVDMKRNKLEVVVTTFDTFRENKEYLNELDWAAVIVDEVHKIKGLKSQTTQALRSLICQHRYGLTGTALQNNMMELWCIIDWAQPEYLGTQIEFHEKYVQLIEQGQKCDATKRELAEARKAKQKFSEIRKTIMIRRTKSLITDQLPQKDDNVVFCKLTEFQMKIYEIILQDPELQDAVHAADPCHCGSNKPQVNCHKKTRSGQSLKSVMFQGLHLLLKAANHVALLLPNGKATNAKKPLSKQICDKIFDEHDQLTRQTFSTLSNFKYSGKMKVLVELLHIFHKKNSKVLLFSYSTRLLDILEVYIMTTQYEFRRIDGKTSPKNRMDIVREFNKDQNIFLCLISTKAGGLGLNMTGANVVIIFDPNWNPSHDLQAQDRAYRIGQRRHVQVFRLISASSIEENIYLRQVYKQQLEKVVVGTENAKRYFLGIQGDQQQKGELFGFKNLFCLMDREFCLAKNILERNKNLEEQLAGHQVARYLPSSVEQQEECENDYCEEDCSEGEQDEEVHKLFGKNQDDDNAFCADWYNDPGHGMELTTLGMSDEAEDLPHNQLLPKPSSKVSDRRLTTDTPHTSGNSQNERNADEKSKATAVSAISEIFSRCGVLHVHKNCQVTGGSRAEDHMTHCAMDEVLLQQKNSQQLAMDCKPYSQTYIDNEKASCKHRGKKMRKIKFLDHNAPKKIPIGIFQILYGQTPTAVLREHLDKMADVLGFSSVIDFCQKVVQISATNRLKMLQQFYTNEHGSKIASLFHSLPTPQTNTDTFSAVSSLAENDQIHVQPKYHPLLYHLTQERNHDTEFNIQTKKVIPQKSRSKTRTRKFVRYQPSYKQELTVKTNPNVQVCNFQKQDVQDSPTISDQVAVANPNRILEVKKHLKTLKSHNGKLHSTNLKNSKPLKHSVIFSEVDNIFLSNEDQKVMSRKPPPRSKTKFKSPTRGITRTLVKLCVSEGNQSSLMERNSSDAALGNLFNSSTLRDSLDDTSKWRKNSQKRKQTLEEQCSFKEGKNEHDSVFITGKMKRISETTSEEEGTPSLF